MVKTHQAVGIIVIAYGNEEGMPELFRRIEREKRPGDYVVLVDNHPLQRCAAIARKTEVVDQVICPGNNLGFAAGCNEGARALPDTIELLLLLNPDALPEEQAITELRTKGQEAWGAWMGLLTLGDGTINSAGNVIHVSGLSWCNAYGLPAAAAARRKEVVLASGACMMIRRSVWDKLGGFAEDYFMYYEDSDFSMMLHRLGLPVGIVPSAEFRHDYVFDKSPLKRYYLERNRYIFMLRQWPLSLLLLFLPLLCVVELGLWGVSILQGTFWIRVRAVGAFLLVLPKVLRRRRALGHLSGSQFLQYIQPAVDTPLLGSIGRSKLVNGFFSAYYRAVVALLR